MTRTALVAAAGALALSACGGSREVKTIATPDCNGPEWTCFQSGPCPFAEFKDSLCAVGEADSISSYSLGIQASETRARREMAAVVSSKVDGFTRAVQDSLSKNNLGEDSSQKVGDLAQNLVEETLHGVAIPRTYFNADTKVYYAIAVLDVKTFASAMKDMKKAKGLSEAAKQDIDKRADGIVNDWRAEVARKNGAPQ